jgi:hypothetical protein
MNSSSNVDNQPDTVSVQVSSVTSFAPKLSTSPTAVSTSHIDAPSNTPKYAHDTQSTIFHQHRPCSCRQSKSDTPPCCSAQWWRETIIGVQWIHARRITQSYLLPFPVFVILCLRIVMMAYSTIVLAYDWVDAWNDIGWYWFMYFTHLSYVGLVIYFWVSAGYCFFSLNNM